MDEFDYDVVARSFGAGSVPGNELIDMYSSTVAETKGSGNLAGIKNEVVDALVEKIVKAPSKKDLISATQALDRVLQHNHYVVPHWNITKFRLIHWDKFGKPKISPKYSLGVGTWWSKEAEKKVEEEKK